MFTVLQKVKFIALLATLVLFFTSCKKDDEPALTNTFTVDGKTFTLDSGFINDFGPSGVDTDTHYNYDFYLLDTQTGAFKAELYVDLYSPGTTNFKVGKFNFIDDDDINTDADIANKYFFVNSSVGLDADGDGIEQSETFRVTAGSVTVSGGTNNNYTVEVDVTLSNGKTVKAKLTYTFPIFD